MNKNICFILNFAPHYREEIFRLIDKELNCDLYFGDKTFTDIKKMNYEGLKNITELSFLRLFGHFYLLRGQTILAFKKYHYYVITGQPYNISSWFLLLINKLLGKKTYIWNHGLYGSEGGLQKILKKIQFKLCTGYLLYGNYAKELMIQQGYNKNKLHVIFNSLYYNKQLEIRKKLAFSDIFKNHFKNDLPTIIFVGRLTKVKKLDLLLKAMKQSFNNKQYFNLVLVGDGIEKKFLEDKVITYELKKQVWFYGSLYDENKIGELFYNASLCVSPGNVGLTSIHALTFGCPVITHNNFKQQMPEFEAIERGVTGDFFDENDSESLRTTIVKWFKEHPVKNSDLVNNCYKVVDTFYNPTKQIELLKSLLK